MKLENGFQGLIWQVPLTNEMGYAYVQTINPNLLGHVSASFLMKILDYHTETPLDKFDPEHFQRVDMLTSHLLAMGTPPQRSGEVRWKPVGYLPLTSADHNLPEFKGLDYQDDAPFSYDIVPQGPTWLVFWGGAVSEYFIEYATFEQSRHLGWLTNFNVNTFHHRVTMEWMRKFNLDYQSYTTSQWGGQFLKNQKYQIKTTVLFSEVDPAIRGKAIGEYHKRF